MGIYIEELKLPRPGCGCLNVQIWPDGTVEIFRVKGLSYKAVTVPDHGTLIEQKPLYDKALKLEAEAMAKVNGSDAMKERLIWQTILAERSAFKLDIADAHVIIPAERS